ELDRLVDEGLQVRERHAPEAPVTGPGAFQTERAGEIARRTGVKPQLRQGVGLDVPACIPQRGEQPLVAGQAGPPPAASPLPAALPAPARRDTSAPASPDRCPVRKPAPACGCVACAAAARRAASGVRR